MNRIEIENDRIISQTLDSSIEMVWEEKNELFSVNSIKIHIVDHTDLEIVYCGEEKAKLNIFFRIDDNTTLNLSEKRTGHLHKVQYKYYLGENSHVKATKISDSNNIKEYNLVYLNGEFATVDYLLKTISTTPEKYDYIVHHNASHTQSDITHHGVNIEKGELTFNISSFIPKKKKGCRANQMSRIVNLTDGVCLIHPNLFIDEYDVEANHAAIIGSFSEDLLFYLKSRGIPATEAYSLLLQGFLKSELNPTLVPYIEEQIAKYWR